MDKRNFSIVTVVKDDPGGFALTFDSFMQLHALDSVEWLVIDSSEDETIKERCMNSPLIRYVYTPPKGIFDAMNIGARLAKGRFVMFVNSGDNLISLSGLETLNYPDSDVLFFNVYSFAGRIQIPLPLVSLELGQIPFSHQAVFTRTKLVRFDTRYRNVADMELFLRLYRSGYRFEYFPTFICRVDQMRMSIEHPWRQRLEPYLVLVRHWLLRGIIVRICISLYCRRLFIPISFIETRRVQR